MALVYENGAGWKSALSTDPVPDGAVVAGYDATDGSRPIYVARSEIHGDLTPGKAVVEPEGTAVYMSVSTEGAEFKRDAFEYLILPEGIYEWKKGSVGNIPANAVPGGYRNASSEPYYVGRALYDGRLTSGKVWKPKGLYIPYGTKEQNFSSYEVLCSKLPLVPDPPVNNVSWLSASSKDPVPTGAVAAGFDTPDGSAPLYVARSEIDGDVTPGKARALSDGTVYMSVSTRGLEFKRDTFEYLILPESDYEWRTASVANFPSNAVEGGYRKESSEPYYIGRTLFDGRLTPGKVWKPKGLFIPYGTKEQNFSTYQVLCPSDPTIHYSNT